jgi:nicotinamidase-related amidase
MMKIFCMLLIISLLSGPGFCADQPGAGELPGREALLLVGLQDSRFPAGEVDSARSAARQAGRVLQEFRKAGELVIHLAWGDLAGDAFAHEVAPERGEPQLVCNAPNPFLRTELLETLRSRGIEHLVICGMSAHLEVEAAVRAAADLDFRCTVISDACGSGDLRWRGQTLPGSDLLLGTMLTLRRHYASILTTEAWLGSH